MLSCDAPGVAARLRSGSVKGEPELRRSRCDAHLRAIAATTVISLAVSSGADKQGRYSAAVKRADLARFRDASGQRRPCHSCR